MRTTFLAGASTSNALADLAKNLKRRVSDAAIEPLLRRPAGELDPVTCVGLLDALSKVSKRGRALKNQKGVLERSAEWERLVERCASQALDASSASLNPKQYISLCTSLSQLRIGESSKLAKMFPRDNDNAIIHLLRHAALCNDPAFVNDGLDLARVNRVVTCVGKDRRDNLWVIPHVCVSIAMALAGDVQPSDGLLKQSKSIWESVSEFEKEFDDRMWDDLAQASVTLNPGDVPSDLYERLKSRGVRVNATRIVSKFQTEVSALIARLNTDNRFQVNHETPEGVDIVLNRKSGEQMAIQCYGPTHYVWSQTRLEGRTKLRELMLTRWHGYKRIERLKATDWDKLGPSKRHALVSSLLV